MLFTATCLQVRPLTPAHAKELFLYRSSPEVARFQGWWPQSLEEVVARLAEHATQPDNQPDAWYPYAIELQDGTLIGDCAIHLLSDTRQAEFGITLAPRFQGQGYAQEAATGLLGYLFGTLRKHRVIASVDPRNVSSMRLMSRLGMRQEAHFVQSLWVRDEWVDDVVFALLRSEFDETVSRR